MYICKGIEQTTFGIDNLRYFFAPIYCTIIRRFLGYFLNFLTEFWIKRLYPFNFPHLRP